MGGVSIIEIHSYALYLNLEVTIMDKFSKEIRSKIMSSIRSKNTTPEINVRSYLHKKGFRFRLHDNTLPCSPDIILKKYKSVIFVHGCFWHHHNDAECRSSHIPKSNVNFWKDKIEKNILRDIKNNKLLQKLRWNVFTIWECETKDEKKLEKLVSNILNSNYS